jgi:exodeoxyribonuclease V alpha subunit
MIKQEVMLPKIKPEELTVHHHFAQYFNDETLEPYLYVLSKRMENGHVCIPMDDSIDDDLKDGGYTTRKINIVEGELVTFANAYESERLTELKPFVFYKNKLYLQRYFVYENTILEKLKAFENNLLVNERKSNLSDHKNFILEAISREEIVHTYSDIEKIDWQAIAAIKGVLNNLTIITGGPGTGKTTTVAKILALLKRVEGEDLSIALAAPTGKAAMRMKESLVNSVKNYSYLGIDSIVNKIETFTIHRLLGTNLNSPFFKHNKNNKLPYKVIIVDESSMIGMSLFAKLVDAIPTTSRLILLGDSEQLASVDAGSLFGDICLSQKEIENKFTAEEVDLLKPLINPHRFENVSVIVKNGFLNDCFVRLKKTYRYDSNSTLGRFNSFVIEGNTEELKNILKNKSTDDLKLDTTYSSTFINDFILKYKAYIDEDSISEALKKMNHCRILCAVKASEEGVYVLNEKVKDLLKKEYKNQKDKFNPSTEIFNNQLIMVTKNQPEMNLFNGDVGLIRYSGGKLKAFFSKQENTELDGGKDYVEVNPGFIASWETVFAMTIHKSQGSEFNEVMVILPKKKENRLLTRELVYTGITRAKNCAYIQTSEEVLYTAVAQQVDRVSGLKDRILNFK